MTTPAERERLVRMALARAVEPQWVDLLRAVHMLGPAEVVTRLRQGSLRRDGRPVVGAAQAARRLATVDPGADLARLVACGARCLVPGDPEWPEWEPMEDELPIALFVRGRAVLGELAARSVSVVGARAATAYGEHTASEITYDLARAGWTVVSGGAFGIDAAAHRGALAGGGPTVVVLACGVDVPYPLAHEGLFEQVLADGGLLVSELPPGAAPLRQRFLARNRLIAGISRGTVVVEAGLRSGSLSSARHAGRFGRVLMAVPGPVTSAMSAGCHRLLREQERTRLVTRAAEVIEECGAIGELAELPSGPPTVRDGLPDALAQLLEALPVRRSVTAEHLADRLGLAISEVLRGLGQLASRGLAEEEPLGAWRLATAPA